MALLVEERLDLLTEDRKINSKLLVKVSHWSFVKQSMMLVVENFAQNSPLYPESALSGGGGRLRAGFPPIREFRENFEDFFQSGKSEKNRGFSAKIREKILKSGNFLQNHFQPFNVRKQLFKWGGFTFGNCICSKLVFL